jgi:acyl carrier protein
MKKEAIHDIVNQIRLSKGLTKFETFSVDTDLRNDLGFSSFDLAELTVRIEDIYEVDIFSKGLITKIGEIYSMLDA